jgi:hypothetical protein
MERGYCEMGIEWYIGIRDGRWLVDGWNDGELQFIEI